MTPERPGQLQEAWIKAPSSALRSGSEDSVLLRSPSLRVRARRGVCVRHFDECFSFFHPELSET